MAGMVRQRILLGGNDTLVCRQYFWEVVSNTCVTRRRAKLPFIHTPFLHHFNLNTSSRTAKSTRLNPCLIGADTYPGKNSFIKSEGKLQKSWGLDNEHG